MLGNVETFVRNSGFKRVLKSGDTNHFPLMTFFNALSSLIVNIGGNTERMIIALIVEPYNVVGSDIRPSPYVCCTTQ